MLTNTQNAQEALCKILSLSISVKCTSFLTCCASWIVHGSPLSSSLSTKPSLIQSLIQDHVVLTCSEPFTQLNKDSPLLAYAVAEYSLPHLFPQAQDIFFKKLGNASLSSFAQILADWIVTNPALLFFPPQRPASSSSKHQEFSNPLLLPTALQFCVLQPLLDLNQTCSFPATRIHATIMQILFENIQPSPPHIFLPATVIRSLADHISNCITTKKDCIISDESISTSVNRLVQVTQLVIAASGPESGINACLPPSLHSFSFALFPHPNPFPPII